MNDMSNKKENLKQQILDCRYKNAQKEYSLCEELEVICQEDNDTEGLVFAQYYKADSLFCDGNVQEADALFEKTKEMAEKYGHKEKLMNCYNALSCTASCFDDQEKLIDNALKCLELAIELEDYEQIWYVNMNLGSVFEEKQDFHEAWKYYQNALKIMDEAKDKQFVDERNGVLFYISLANVCLNIGEKENAEYFISLIEKYDEAEVYEKYGLQIKELKAWIYYKYGDLDKALSKADEILNDDSYKLISAYVYGEVLKIVEIYAKAQKYQKALKILDKLSETHVQDDNLDMGRRIYTWYIKIYTCMGMHDMTDKYYEKYYQNAIQLQDMQKQRTSEFIHSRMDLEDALLLHKKIENENEKWELLSKTDELTGVLNRNGMYEYEKENFIKAKKQKIPFAVLIIDADHFKEINDTYGHFMGDECLKATAHEIAGTVEPGMITVRYGGDEFMVLGTGLTSKDVKKVADRICAKVSECKMCDANGEHISLSCSIGAFNAIPQKEEQMNYFIHMADKALYKSKEAGRNQATIIDGECS